MTSAPDLARGFVQFSLHGEAQAPPAQSHQIGDAHSAGDNETYSSTTPASSEDIACALSELSFDTDSTGGASVQPALDELPPLEYDDDRSEGDAASAITDNESIVSFGTADEGGNIPLQQVVAANRPQPLHEHNLVLRNLLAEAAADQDGALLEHHPLARMLISKDDAWSTPNAQFGEGRAAHSAHLTVLVSDVGRLYPHA
ncbi:hypothetical protein BAUCODRAFT_20832 [Baudoinia panamericana UAMH 10762]|uniref:Uncharacterized protein n=1 Tax=Baudoinia panamericana (strain UAMH 10762) TaxID=717646 RepID=M2M188_BAUPA|nr:uncharacterized protein BAUCODRAFT_20832 [Baudoinia panamericana UAMH 10762]EMD00808.1 hypothetical protein BAUCODRAFT_20832 [Baudoinia panamericana UAMH 10762]